MTEWLTREDAGDGVAVVRMAHGEENRFSGAFCAAVRALLEALDPQANRVLPLVPA